MSFVVIHTDPHHTDFSHEQAELDAIGATLRPLNVTTEEEVAAACREADGLLVTYARIGKVALAGMPKLKIVVRTGVGTIRSTCRRQPSERSWSPMCRITASAT